MLSDEQVAGLADWMMAGSPERHQIAKMRREDPGFEQQWRDGVRAMFTEADANRILANPQRTACEGGKTC